MGDNKRKHWTVKRTWGVKEKKGPGNKRGETKRVQCYRTEVKEVERGRHDRRGLVLRVRDVPPATTSVALSFVLFLNVQTANGLARLAIRRLGGSLSAVLNDTLALDAVDDRDVGDGRAILSRCTGKRVGHTFNRKASTALLGIVLDVHAIETTDAGVERACLESTTALEVTTLRVYSLTWGRSLFCRAVTMIRASAEWWGHVAGEFRCFCNSGDGVRLALAVGGSSNGGVESLKGGLFATVEAVSLRSLIVVSTSAAVAATGGTVLVVVCAYTAFQALRGSRTLGGHVPSGNAREGLVGGVRLANASSGTNGAVRISIARGVVTFTTLSLLSSAVAGEGG